MDQHLERIKINDIPNKRLRYCDLMSGCLASLPRLSANFRVSQRPISTNLRGKIPRANGSTYCSSDRKSTHATPRHLRWLLNACLRAVIRLTAALEKLLVADRTRAKKEVHSHSLRLSESNSHLDNLSCLVCADRQFSTLVEWWRKRRRNFGILPFVDSTLPKSWKSSTSRG